MAIQDPTTRVRLMPGHAGRGRKGNGPEFITLHIQEGTNDLFYEFLNRPADNQADCTVWVKQDGSIERFLNDTDTPWTNGDLVAPDMSNPYIAAVVATGADNTNRYAYTVEHQGFAKNNFTDAAIEATAKMCAYWMAKEGWTDVEDRITGHYQVGNHKGCPGALFPWAKLRARVKELLGTPDRTTQGTTFPPKFYETNPQGFSVGPGVLAKATEWGLTILTNEQFFVADADQPGLGKMSRTYVRDANMRTFVIMASEQPELAQPGKDTPWKVEQFEFKR